MGFLTSINILFSASKPETRCVFIRNYLRAIPWPLHWRLSLPNLRLIGSSIDKIGWLSVDKRIDSCTPKCRVCEFLD